MPAPRLSVICIRPQGSANIGAIARVMANFGLDDLYLVAPECPVDDQSYRMACHGDGVLRRARVVDALDPLLPRFHGLIGTCGRSDTSAFGTPHTPAAAAAAVRPLADRNPLAVVLGPEDHGLSNEELKLCRWIVRIPTASTYASLNIAQAAAILLYELCARPDSAAPPAVLFRPASDAEMEAFYRQLRDLLLDVGFLHTDNPERIMYTLRRLLGRSGPDRRELKILRGIVRQAAWALEQAGWRGRRRGGPDAGGIRPDRT